jgi:hypothetical protein
MNSNIRNLHLRSKVAASLTPHSLHIRDSCILHDRSTSDRMLPQDLHVSCHPDTPCRELLHRFSPGVQFIQEVDRISVDTLLPIFRLEASVTVLDNTFRRQSSEVSHPGPPHTLSHPIDDDLLSCLTPQADNRKGSLQPRCFCRKSTVRAMLALRSRARHIRKKNWALTTTWKNSKTFLYSL